MKKKIAILVLLIATLFAIFSVQVMAKDINSFTIKIGGTTYNATSGGTQTIQLDSTSQLPLTYSASASGSNGAVTVTASGAISATGTKGSISGSISSAGTITFKAQKGSSVVQYDVNITIANYANTRYKWSNYATVHVDYIECVQTQKRVGEKWNNGTSDGATSLGDITVYVNGTYDEAQVAALIQKYFSQYDGYAGKQYNIHFWRDAILYDTTEDNADGTHNPFATLRDAYKPGNVSKFTTTMKNKGYSSVSIAAVEANKEGNITVSVPTAYLKADITENWYVNGKLQYTRHSTASKSSTPTITSEASALFAKVTTLKSSDYTYEKSNYTKSGKTVKTITSGGTISFTNDGSSTYVINHYYKSVTKAKLIVKVVDRNDKAISGATVTCTSPTGTNKLDGFTGSTHTYTVTPPTSGSTQYTFQATKAGYVTNSASVKIDSSTTTATVTIKLDKKGTITD